MAENVVETILVKLGLDASSYNQDADKAVKKNEKLNKSIGETDKIVGTVGKTLGRFFGVIAAATGISKLIDDVQRLNDELYHLEKNLGMSSTTIKAWQGAAGAMGGSADGMTSSMKSLNMAMNDFVIMGDTSMLPYMNALGVSMVGTNGKLKDTNDVMLDLADSFSKMDREQAFSIASKMGIDEGTFNTLVQGRKEMEKMIEYQKTMYQSSEAELQVSRDLAKNRALLGQQWESMKTMMGNILMPLFLKVSEVLLGLFDYLQKHQREVKAVFTGLAFIVGAVLTPVLIKAAIAAAAFLAPILLAAAPVIALGAAFGLLYDDYKTWAEGGKSLFNWGAFTDYINNSKLSVDNLKQGFVFLLTGYKDWASAAEGGREWLKLKGFIEDNKVSVDSLKNGFKNLASELMSNVIPTLQGYGSILQKLFKGDFGGAFAEAKEMGKEYWRQKTMEGNAIGERVRGSLDIATGQEMGTASQVDVMASGGKGKPTRGFTAEKGKSIAASAKRLGISPNDLAAVISFETSGTFDPSIQNPKSSATGLIQFMKGSGGTKGQYYGMDRDKFGSLSFDEQMKYVEKYFQGRGFKEGGSYSTGDVYGAVTGYGYKKGTDAYHLNKVWDSNKNGVVEKGEMVQNPAFRSHQREFFPNGATGAQQSMRQGTNQIPSNMRSASVNSRIDTKIGDINVYTTASSITGVAQDAAGAFSNQIVMMTPSLG